MKDWMNLQQYKGYGKIENGDGKVVGTCHYDIWEQQQVIREMTSSGESIVMGLQRVVGDMSSLPIPQGYLVIEDGRKIFFMKLVSGLSFSGGLG